jgi:phage FluMu gp28-like protein
MKKEQAARKPKTLYDRAQRFKPVLDLLPYQRRWIDDDSPLKIAVKARQIGYSFAATLRAVMRCLTRKTTWIFLSKGERQSRLLMEKVQEHVQTCGIVAAACQSAFFQDTQTRQLEIRFPNGSVIYGLPANPDTARGYTGHVTLDEFAFHTDANKIFAALFPSITRGFGLEVISTPNGQQGKFYELAKAAGLAGVVMAPRAGYPQPDSATRLMYPKPKPVTWAAHWCDIYEAVHQGLKLDVELLRSGCDDDQTWLQEYCCQFVNTAESFIPPSLLDPCLSAEAAAALFPTLPPAAPAPFFLPPATAAGAREGEVEGALPAAASPASLDGSPSLAGAPAGPAESPSLAPSRPARQAHSPYDSSGFHFPLSAQPSYFLGIDIGRHHDRTVFWLDETFTPPALAPSAPPESDLHSFTPGAPPLGPLSVCRLLRTFQDVPFDDQLTFARALLSLRGSDGLPVVRRACVDATGMGAPLAESLARQFGPRVEPVVFTAAVKEDLAYRVRRRLENRLSVLPDTREVRRAFLAIRRLNTVSGSLRLDAVRSEAGHADEFWAKALADLAADCAPVVPLTDGFLVEGAPIISPAAFLELPEGAWTELGW